MFSLWKIWIIIFITLLPACTFHKKPSLVQLPFPEVAELLQNIDRQNSNVKSLEGRMSSKIENSYGRSSTTQLILLKKPAFLRLDALTPFGQPAVTVSTDGEMIFLYNHSKRRYFTGMARSHHLFSLLPPMLSVKDLTLILTGGIPIIDYEESRVTVDKVKGYYILILTKGERREEIYYDFTNLDPAKAIIYDGINKIILSLSMDEYENFDGERVPTIIKIVLPAENYELEVNYSQINLNTIEETSYFALNPPEGVIIENLNGHMF